MGLIFIRCFLFCCGASFTATVDNSICLQAVSWKCLFNHQSEMLISFLSPLSSESVCLLFVCMFITIRTQMLLKNFLWVFRIWLLLLKLVLTTRAWIRLNWISWLHFECWHYLFLIRVHILLLLLLLVACLEVIFLQIMMDWLSLCYVTRADTCSSHVLTQPLKC